MSWMHPISHALSGSMTPLTMGTTEPLVPRASNQFVFLQMVRHLPESVLVLSARWAVQIWHPTEHARNSYVWLPGFWVRMAYAMLLNNLSHLLRQFSMPIASVLSEGLVVSFISQTPMRVLEKGNTHSISISRDSARRILMASERPSASTESPKNEAMTTRKEANDTKCFIMMIYDHRRPLLWRSTFLLHLEGV